MASTATARELDGVSAVVVGSAAPVGARIADALRAERVAVVVTDAADRASVDTAFDEAARRGSLEIAVHAHLGSAGDDMPLLATLTTLQAARRCLTDGGRVLVVVPSFDRPGLSWRVPLRTAAEAQRSVVRTASRSWAAAGIEVEVLGVPVDGPADDDVDVDVAHHAAWLLGGDAPPRPGLTIIR